MTQVIKTYPNLQAAYILMERCNGGINRDRSEEQALLETDPVIGADGVYHNDLVAIDQWLGTLSEDDLLTFVDGEQSEVEVLAASGSEASVKAHGLLNDLFNSEAM